MTAPYPVPPGPVPPRRKRRKWPWVTGGVVVGLLVLFVIIGVSVPPAPGDTASVASASPTTSAAPMALTSRWAGLGTVIATGQVSEVVDGDTVHVSTKNGDYYVRILGINAPEAVEPNAPAQCWGSQASQYAHQQLDGKIVSLLSDPTQAVTDKYGRMLAYVIEPDDTNYSLAAVKAGNAREYVYDTPVRLDSALLAAQAAAKAAGKGLWGPPCHGSTTSPAPSPTTTVAPKAVPLTTTTQAPPPKSVTTNAPAPPQRASNCVPSYSPCIPVGPDLDCSDIGHPVYVHGADPYRLDRDGDGVGCEGH